MNTGTLKLVISLSALLLAAPILSVCQAAPDKGLTKFLTPAGKLQSSLTLRDSQGGFAGYSGELWTIDTNGHFTIARFLNDKTDAPHWHRDLSQAQLKSLAQVLSENHFCDLPAVLGGEPKVNPHSLTLTFGEKQATLVLPPGKSLDEMPAPQEDAQAWRDFTTLAKALQDLAKDRSPAR